MKNLKTYLLIFSAFIIIVLLLQKEKETSKLNAKISTMELKHQKDFDSLKNKYGNEIKTQQAIVFEKEKTLQKYSDSIFALKRKDDRKYKETVAYYENYIKTSLPEVVYVDLDSSTPKIDTTYLSQKVKDYINNSISVPNTFSIDSPYFKMKGAINKTNVAINKIEFTDSLYGRFVVKNKGLFKKDVIEYQVMNKSPYNNITGLKSAIYKPKRKTGEHIVFFFIGALTSFLILNK